MPAPRVFISYSHDSEAHREAVLDIAHHLRAWGIDVRLDRFVPAPDEGWPLWMMTQVDTADFVLIVCTETYRRRFEGHEALGKGKGITFEGLLSIQHIYEANARNTKFLPVVLDTAADTDVPLILRPYTRYTLPGQFEALYRHLTGQPEVIPAPIGARKILPQRSANHSVTLPAAPTTSGPTVIRTMAIAATVRSEGGHHIQIEPLELLQRLLLTLFSSSDQFRQWIRFGPEGHALIAEIPGAAAATTTAIFHGLDVLERRGYLDACFFVRLITEFPHRRQDVARIAAAWGLALNVSSAAPVAADSAAPALEEQ